MMKSALISALMISLLSNSNLGHDFFRENGVGSPWRPTPLPCTNLELPQTTPPLQKKREAAARQLRPLRGVRWLPWGKVG
jgi:hypothetical protein